MAVAYERGKGGPTSFADAVKWYTISAERNHPPAIANLVLLHMNGLSNNPPNQETAYMWLLIAKRLRHRFGGQAHEEMDRLEAKLAGGLDAGSRAAATERATAWLSAHPYPSSNDYVPPGTGENTRTVDDSNGKVSVPVPDAVPYEEFVKLRPSR